MPCRSYQSGREPAPLEASAVVCPAGLRPRGTRTPAATRPSVLAGGDALRDAHRPPAVPVRDTYGYGDPGGPGGADAATAQFLDPERPGDDYPQGGSIDRSLDRSGPELIDELKRFLAGERILSSSRRLEPARMGKWPLLGGLLGTATLAFLGVIGWPPESWFPTPVAGPETLRGRTRPSVEDLLGILAAAIAVVPWNTIAVPAWLLPRTTAPGEDRSRAGADLRRACRSSFDRTLPRSNCCLGAVIGAIRTDSSIQGRLIEGRRAVPASRRHGADPGRCGTQAPGLVRDGDRNDPGQLLPHLTRR